MSDVGAMIAAALTIGLLGNVHCAAMCGGLAAALTLGIPADATAGARVGILAALSAGRILGYAVVGVVVGTAGIAVTGFFGTTGAAGLRVLAGLALLGIAAMVAGGGRAPLGLERLGARVWRHLQPLAVALRSDLRGTNALALGLLWGWLPCGLVYSALGFAATSGDPGRAALVMVAFGLGTLPGVLLPSVAAHRFGTFAQARASRRAAAAMLAAFGIWTMVGAATMLRAAASGGTCHDATAAAQPR